jgi:hypothetical protein
MKIDKSSRHSKITGDFAENLVLYWLSKYGFECARVDHTGIDLIAKNPNTGELMGISVKGRSRNEDRGDSHLPIRKDNFDKAQAACQAFNCTPYFAIVVDRENETLIFILSMEKLLTLFPPGERVSAWKMREKWLNQYLVDPDIQIIRFKHKIVNWWSTGQVVIE